MNKSSVWLSAAVVLSTVLTVAAPSISVVHAESQVTKTPLATVNSELAQAIAIIHNPEIPLEERRRALRQLAESNLDLAWMARGTLGDHWSELAPNQRSEYVKLFTRFIEDVYLDKIQDYVQFKITVDKARALSPGLAEVEGTLTQPHEEPQPIIFQLEKRPDRWIVYDVAVEGVSMVENYRAQFNRVIEDRGLAQLFDDLRTKQKQLAADG